MSEIEDIADMEFDELLQHVGSGELDVIESRTDGQDLSEEVLGVVLAPTDDTLSTCTCMSGMANTQWEV